MLKLYGIAQSRAFRNLWMLEELGVPYENVPVSFIGDVQKPDYLKINPNAKIPALDDDGLVLTVGYLIMEARSVEVVEADDADLAYS